MKKEDVKSILKKNIRQIKCAYRQDYIANIGGYSTQKDYAIFLSDTKAVVYHFDVGSLWYISIVEFKPVKKLIRTKKELNTLVTFEEEDFSYKEFQEMTDIIKAEMKRRKEEKVSEVLAKIN